MIFLRKRTLDWKNFFAQKNKSKVFLQNKIKAKQLSAINRTSVFFVEETDLKKKISSSNYRQTPPPSCHYDQASVYWNSIEEENIILTSFLSKKKEKFSRRKEFFSFSKNSSTKAMSEMGKNNLQVFFGNAEHLLKFCKWYFSLEFKWIIVIYYIKWSKFFNLKYQIE